MRLLRKTPQESRLIRLVSAGNLAVIKHDAPAVFDLPKVVVKWVAEKMAAGKTALIV
jgi:hypothetical protein